MSKCIHLCGRSIGYDGQCQISCSAFDKKKDCEECNEYCIEYEEEGKTFHLENIVWDTDGEPVEGLPIHCIVECADKEEIADTLSDEYGWLVKSFDIDED